MINVSTFIILSIIGSFTYVFPYTSIAKQNLIIKSNFDFYFSFLNLNFDFKIRFSILIFVFDFSNSMVGLQFLNIKYDKFLKEIYIHKYLLIYAWFLFGKGYYFYFVPILHINHSNNIHLLLNYIYIMNILCINPALLATLFLHISTQNKKDISSIISYFL